MSQLSVAAQAGILERVVETLFFLPLPPPFLLAGFALEESTIRLHTFLIIFRRAKSLGGTVVSVVARNQDQDFIFFEEGFAVLPREFCWCCHCLLCLSHHQELPSLTPPPPPPRFENFLALKLFFFTDRFEGFTLMSLVSLGVPGGTLLLAAETEAKVDFLELLFF